MNKIMSGIRVLSLSLSKLLKDLFSKKKNTKWLSFLHIKKSSYKHKAQDEEFAS